MTKEEIKKAADEFKAQYDKETRRDLRLYWLFACLVCFVLGYGLHALAG